MKVTNKKLFALKDDVEALRKAITTRTAEIDAALDSLFSEKDLTKEEKAQIKVIDKAIEKLLHKSGLLVASHDRKLQKLYQRDEAGFILA